MIKTKFAAFFENHICIGLEKEEKQEEQKLGKDLYRIERNKGTQDLKNIYPVYPSFKSDQKM
jgi:hypothetical protein